jgi:opacity protein-like surface antigen
MLKIYFSLVAIISTFLFCLAASAQSSNPKLQIFGGYSFVHTDSGGLNPQVLDLGLGLPSNRLGTSSNFNGWNAEAQYNLKPWLGVVADVGGRYGTPLTASSGSGITGLPRSSAYSLMLGPVVSFKAASRIAPFVHALFGFDRLNLNAATISGLPASAPASSAAVTDTNFAMALGGGIDYKLSPHAALRVGQVDYLYTAHNMNTVYGDAFGPGRFGGLPTRENNLRFSTGIVFRF